MMTLKKLWDTAPVWAGVLLLLGLIWGFFCGLIWLMGQPWMPSFDAVAPWVLASGLALAIWRKAWVVAWFLGAFLVGVAGFPMLSGFCFGMVVAMVFYEQLEQCQATLNFVTRENLAMKLESLDKTERRTP